MNLKKTFSFFIALIFFVSSIAQDSLRNGHFSKMPIRTIALEQSSGKIKPSLAFSDVHVLDARADTSAVCFDKILFQSENKVHKVFVEEGISKSFKNFISNSYALAPKTDTSNNLFIAIKKLWLSDQVPYVSNIDASKTKWESGLILQAEVYSEQNGIYHALYKIDSIVVADLKIAGNEKIYLSHGIEVLLAKIRDKDRGQIRHGKTSFSLETIKNHLAAMYDYPILSSSVLKKGVYKTFEEFRNNEPSINNFEVKKDLKTDALYMVDLNGNQSLLRDCWGYCDGTNIYMKSSDNFFLLERSGKTFNLRGFKSLTMRENIKIGNLLAWGVLGGAVGKQNKSVSYVGKMKDFQLDIETGELF